MTCHKRVTFAKSAKYDYFCILPLFCTEFHTFYINNESTQWYMSTQVDFRQGAHSFFFLCYVIPNIYIRIKPLVWHSEDKHEAKTHTHIEFIRMMLDYCKHFYHFTRGYCTYSRFRAPVLIYRYYWGEGRGGVRLSFHVIIVCIFYGKTSARSQCFYLLSLLST